MTLKKNYLTKPTNKQLDEQRKLGKIKHRKEEQNTLEAQQEIEDFKKGKVSDQ
jgi:hypothetical protein